MATISFANSVGEEQLRSGKQTSLILRLSKSLTATDDLSEARSAVIKHALDLLSRIHNDISAQQAAAPGGTRLESPNERRMISALLDLIVLEGIYPALSQGVGIPIERRARSFTLPSLITNGSARVEEVIDPDHELLGTIVGGLQPLLEASNTPQATEKSRDPWSRRFKGVEGMIRERCLVDVIAASGELAFNPQCAEHERRARIESFNKLLDGSVCSKHFIYVQANYAAEYRRLS